MTLSVGAPANGRVGWGMRLDPSPLSASSEDLDGARMLTAALRERLSEIPHLPAILVETARFEQVQEPNRLPYESSGWCWNWFVSGSVPAEENQDWRTICSAIDIATTAVIAPIENSAREGDDLAKRIKERFQRGAFGED
jgi:hypothetical protein